VDAIISSVAENAEWEWDNRSQAGRRVPAAVVLGSLAGNSFNTRSRPSTALFPLLLDSGRWFLRSPHSLRLQRSPHRFGPGPGKLLARTPLLDMRRHRDARYRKAHLLSLAAAQASHWVPH